MNNEEKILAILEQMQGDIEELKRGQANLEAGQANLEAGQAKLEAGQANLEGGQANLEAGQRKLETTVSKMDKRLSKVEDGQAKLQNAQISLQESYKQQEAALLNLATQMSEEQAKLNRRVSRIALGQKRIEKSLDVNFSDIYDKLSVGVDMLDKKSARLETLIMEEKEVTAQNAFDVQMLKRRAQ